MDAAFFQKVKDIFADALEQAPENRAAFVLEKCDTDKDLFNEVRSLLEAHEEPENLIEKNALDFRHDLSITGNGILKSYTGKQFGNYKILQEIGQGGMGAVFLATRNDGEFSRQVALKIVRQTILDAETERHFRRERDILASLNHPNIAQLYDGGVSNTGEVFLAMELVEGENLLDFAESNKLSVEEKLKLFLKICAAVSYAHRNLTVHRDIKPSNILVTNDGEPKLLDFGLAKMSEPSAVADSLSLISEISNYNLQPSATADGSDFTETVFRAFTPAYASPEQILGKKVTTASDVYSLGVVFYELVSGEKPFQFEGKSLEEIIKTITNLEPLLPSAVQGSRFKVQDSKKENPTTSILHPKLKGDIDKIALKAIQKEPENRYRSVEEFAGDIERHLIDFPILAHPNTISYRAMKFFKRNKIAVSATILIFLSIVTGLIFTLWQANETRKERDRAEKRFGEVRKLSNSLLFEISPKIENLSGSTETRRLLVQNALEYLDSLATESQNDAQLQSELASAYEKIGDLQGNPNKANVSDFTGAIASYEKANQIRRNLPESFENLTLLAKNYLQLSAVRYVQNDFQFAIQNSEDSLKNYEKLSQRSDSPQIQNDFLEARIDNAQIYADNNQYKTAIPLFEKILESINGSSRNDKEFRRLSVKAETFYANALSWDGRQKEAETAIKKTIFISEKLLSDFPKDGVIKKQIWRTFSVSASIYEDVKNQISYSFARKALTIAENSVAADAFDLQAKQNLAKSFSRLGNNSVLLGKLSEALDFLKKSQEISRQLIEQAPNNITYLRDFGRLHIRFGDLFREQKDFIKALENYEKSVEYFEKVASFDEKYTLARRDTAQSMKNVGEMQIKLEQTPQAKITFHNALEILTELNSQNALGEYDQKMITEMQTTLEKL